MLSGNSDQGYERWLLGRLGLRCRSEQLNREKFGFVWLTRFTCKSPPCAAAAKSHPIIVRSPVLHRFFDIVH